MKIVALNSGGFDSVLMLRMIRDENPDAEIHTLFFEYGQNNAELEGKCAEKSSIDSNSIFHKVLLPKFSWSSSSMFDKSSHSNSGDDYIEMRNFIFLAYAASLCQSIGAESIYFAILKDVEYLDCTEEFKYRVSEVLDLAGISLYAPFVGYNKVDLKYLAFKYNIGREDYFSCNHPSSNNKPCGECLDCCALDYIHSFVESKKTFKDLVVNNIDRGSLAKSSPPYSIEMEFSKTLENFIKYRGFKQLLNDNPKKIILKVCEDTDIRVFDSCINYISMHHPGSIIESIVPETVFPRVVYESFTLGDSKIIISFSNHPGREVMELIGELSKAERLTPTFLVFSKVFSNSSVFSFIQDSFYLSGVRNFIVRGTMLDEGVDGKYVTVQESLSSLPEGPSLCFRVCGVDYIRESAHQNLSKDIDLLKYGSSLIFRGFNLLVDEYDEHSIRNKIWGTSISRYPYLGTPIDTGTLI